MHFVYHMIPFISYFHILVHCKGGHDGGKAGKGGFRGSFIGGGGGGSSTSCETHECRLLAGLFGVALVVPTGVWILISACRVCYRRYKNQPGEEVRIFVNAAYQQIDRQEANDAYPFLTGIWSSRYFQCERWYGPHQFSLSFDAQSMNVKGTGSDDVGIFIIDGIYSKETNQVDLRKIYQLDTGNHSENLGHQVTIHLIWNTQNRQFEGKWYVQTRTYYDDGGFVLRVYETSINIESDSDGRFNVNSPYPELLHECVTREDYLHFLSKINSLQKRLQRYGCLLDACALLTGFLIIAVFALSIFWRLYFDAPGWTFIIVEFIVPACIGGLIGGCVRSKIETLSEELKSTTNAMANTYFEWTLQMNDSSKKIILHVERRLPCSKDVITPTAATIIDIDEPISLHQSLVQYNADVHDPAASTVRIGLDDENIASCDTTLLPSDDKVALDTQKQSQQQPNS